MGTNESTKKTAWKSGIMISSLIAAALMSGCVISLNIQKNNTNSNQKVEQTNDTKNDSINFSNLKK